MREYPAGVKEIAHDRIRHDAIDETVGYNDDNRADRSSRTRGAAARNYARRVASFLIMLLLIQSYSRVI